MRRPTSMACGALFAMHLLPAAARAQSACGDLDAVVTRANELRRAGQHDEALGLLSGLGAHCAMPRARAQLGLAELSARRWRDADEHLSAALEASDDPWVTLHRATLEDARARAQARLATSTPHAAEPRGAPVLAQPGSNVATALQRLPAVERASDAWAASVRAHHIAGAWLLLGGTVLGVAAGGAWLRSWQWSQDARNDPAWRRFYAPSGGVDGTCADASGARAADADAARVRSLCETNTFLPPLAIALGAAAGLTLAVGVVVLATSPSARRAFVRVAPMVDAANRGVIVEATF